jgi:hypothetical protein
MLLATRLAVIALVALVWAVTWAAAALIAVLVASVVDPGLIDLGEGPAELVPMVAMAGLIGGIGFGLLMAMAERGRPIADVPVWRALAWGAIAGVGLTLLEATTAPEPSTLLLGIVAAGITIAIARTIRRRRYRADVAVA